MTAGRPPVQGTAPTESGGPGRTFKADERLAEGLAAVLGLDLAGPQKKSTEG